ncbi:hypothetical protein Ddye_001341 [Dipteronia dyeriana]|uniref:Reverse transcriptase domain-containing protein n=1 Tax=Dipteronia dyeriana TaxID=168575 RepID=A0AAD9XNU4_9ROSI|nr:hypothetical protein Ddye_001341 [Dipteronia dyeriana]
MEEFHNNGSVVKNVNKTFIALVRKIKNPVHLKDYRPISLVGSFYKILAKVLANRLKKLMKKIISPYQMAFVSGRTSVRWNPFKESLWLPVIKKVEDRLAPSRRSLLSEGGNGGSKKNKRNFFWNDGALKKKIHAVDWVSLCKSKRFGGLGIGRIKDKGVSLLAKWIRRFGNEHSSLWKTILCAKYGVNNKGIIWDFSQGKD